MYFSLVSAHTGNIQGAPLGAKHCMAHLTCLSEGTVHYEEASERT